MTMSINLLMWMKEFIFNKIYYTAPIKDQASINKKRQKDYMRHKYWMTPRSLRHTVTETQ